MKKITVQEVEHIAHGLAKAQMSWDEPIPDFGTGYPGKLESCLANAFQTYDKRELYPTLIDKAAVIFFCMIKDHPFLNGNKRIAVTTLLVFFYINGKWLSVSNEEMYEIAVGVAKSSPKVRRGQMAFIRDFLRVHQEKLS